MTPSITIGIPSCNQAEFLTDAIQSALDQTVPCEIIVVDDGSTDNSLQIAKSYEKYGVKVVSQVNKGLSSARNTIIMNMRGDYLMPLDADDMLKENCVEKILEVIQKTDADIVAPSFKTFGTTNAEIILNPLTEFRHFAEANRIGYFSATRKTKLLEIGGYSPKMVWGYEDYHLWINLLKRGAKLVTIKDILVLYRTKEHSMITTAQAHHQELMQQIMKDNPELYVS